MREHVKVLLMSMVALILLNSVISESSLDSYIEVSQFDPSLYRDPSSYLSEDHVDRTFSVQNLLISRDEQYMECNFDSDCNSNQACCSKVPGVSKGQCYNTTTHTCCVEDSSIIMISTMKSVSGNECCNSSQDLKTLMTCSTGYACVPSGCASTCSSSASCNAGYECCVGSQSNSNNRCFDASSSICCGDGRICTREACSNIPDGGSCCAVSFDSGVYSFCKSGFKCQTNSTTAFCSPINSDTPSSNDTSASTSFISTASSLYPNTNRTIQGGTFGNANDKRKKEGIDTGLLIGIIIAAVVLVAIILASVFIYIHWPRSSPPKNREHRSNTLDQLVLPNYARSAGSSQRNSAELRDMEKYEIKGSNDPIPASMIGRHTIHASPPDNRTASSDSTGLYNNFSDPPSYTAHNSAFSAYNNVQSSMNPVVPPTSTRSGSTNTTISNSSGIPLPPTPRNHNSLLCPVYTPPVTSQPPPYEEPLSSRPDVSEFSEAINNNSIKISTSDQYTDTLASRSESRMQRDSEYNILGQLSPLSRDSSIHSDVSTPRLPAHQYYSNSALPELPRRSN